MLASPRLSQQHADIQHAVFQQQKELTTLSPSFKQTLLEKYEVNGLGSHYVPTYLVKLETSPFVPIRSLD